MNLAEYMDRFYRDLGEPNTNRFPVDLLKSWFDDAQRVVNKKAKCVYTSTDQSASSDTRTYSYPSDILGYNIDDIYYDESDTAKRIRLKPTFTQKLDLIDPEWRDRNGTPQFWYHDYQDGKLGLYPYETSVSGSNHMLIHYRGKHTKMTHYYTTGTVSITNGTTAVTGSGTAFVGNVVAGDQIGIGKLLDKTTTFPAVWYTVETTPTSNTALTITSSYAETSASGSSYIIASNSSFSNNELDMCSLLYALALAKFKDKDYNGRTVLMNEMYQRLYAEMNNIRHVAASNEPSVPMYNSPPPGGRLEDYGIGSYSGTNSAVQRGRY